MDGWLSLIGLFLGLIVALMLVTWLADRWWSDD